ncbi:MAG: hypothetical protein JST82_00850 [Bacteroidetes bacterium]|nr:hypothetical protein [Bacteroidota bacterium]
MNKLKNIFNCLVLIFIVAAISSHSYKIYTPTYDVAFSVNGKDGSAKISKYKVVVHKGREAHKKKRKGRLRAIDYMFCTESEPVIAVCFYHNTTPTAIYHCDAIQGKITSVSLRGPPVV